MPRTSIAAALLTVMLVPLGAAAQDCGHPYDSPGRFGPFDYNDPARRSELRLVEVAHFTSYMEEIALHGVASRRAQSAQEADGYSLIAGNFDYTLHAFPNHARALHAMGVWQLRMRKDSPLDYQRTVGTGGLMSANCYFQRAIMFTPNDGMVRHAYGAFLHQAGELDAAAAQYEKAIELLPNSPEPYYNLGLLHFERREYDKARVQADKAYALGYPLPGLRRKLAQLERSN
jgi:tetratricopeptide (TPR) repeat protein